MLLKLLNEINETSILFERDVLNARELKNWVTEMASRVRTPVGQKWFSSQLFQFLINRYESANAVQQVTTVDPSYPDWLKSKLESGAKVISIKPDQELVTVIGEVSDWINAWIEENGAARINFTWEQAVDASKKWHAELSRMQASDNPDDEAQGTELVYKHDNGYYWVLVNSNSCLSREGGRMGHCVGSYGSSVSQGHTRIYSLRNPSNHPHVTVEVNNPEPRYQPPRGGPDQGEVNQIKGKQNAAPVTPYIDMVVEFLRAMGMNKFSYGGRIDLKNMGYFMKDDKLEHLSGVASVIKEYPDGFKWAELDLVAAGLNNRGNGELLLVDKGWSIHVAMVTEGRTNREVTSLNLPRGNRKRYSGMISEFIDGKSYQYTHSAQYLFDATGFGLNDGRIGEVTDVCPVVDKIPAKHNESRFNDSSYDLRLSNSRNGNDIILIMNGDSVIGSVIISNGKVTEVKLPYGIVRIKKLVTTLMKQGYEIDSQLHKAVIDSSFYASGDYRSTSELIKMEPMDTIRVDNDLDASWVEYEGLDEIFLLSDDDLILGYADVDGSYDITDFGGIQLLNYQGSALAYAVIAYVEDTNGDYGSQLEDTLASYGFAIGGYGTTPYYMDTDMPVRISVWNGEEVVNEYDSTAGDFSSEHYSSDEYMTTEMWKELTTTGRNFHTYEYEGDEEYIEYTVRADPNEVEKRVWYKLSVDQLP